MDDNIPPIMPQKIQDDPVDSAPAKPSVSRAESKSRTKAQHQDQVVIKKYANRRLYNTATSAYVTLDNLSDMVRKGVDFVVYDAKTGDDITRGVLAQIIFEEESRGHNLLPIQFLRQLIGFYGDSMQSLVPTYLEMSLDSFSRQQEQFRAQFQKTFTTAPLNPAVGISFFDDQIKQNMVLFDRAMRMFTPFNFAQTTPSRPSDGASETETSEKTAKNTADAQDVADLKAQIAQMREEIAHLSKKT